MRNLADVYANGLPAAEYRRLGAGATERELAFWVAGTIRDKPWEREGVSAFEFWTSTNPVLETLLPRRKFQESFYRACIALRVPPPLAVTFAKLRGSNSTTVSSIVLRELRAENLLTDTGRGDEVRAGRERLGRKVRADLTEARFLKDKLAAAFCAHHHRAGTHQREKCEVPAGYCAVIEELVKALWALTTRGKS